MKVGDEVFSADGTKHVVAWAGASYVITRRADNGYEICWCISPLTPLIRSTAELYSQQWYAIGPSQMSTSSELILQIADSPDKFVSGTTPFLIRKVAT